MYIYIYSTDYGKRSKSLFTNTANRSIGPRNILIWIVLQYIQVIIYIYIYYTRVWTVNIYEELFIFYCYCILIQLYNIVDRENDDSCVTVLEARITLSIPPLREVFVNPSPDYPRAKETIKNRKFKINRATKWCVKNYNYRQKVPPWFRFAFGF